MIKKKKNLTLSAISTLHSENNRYFVPIPTLRRDNSGIEPCQVGIPTSSEEVRIPTLSGTILELSRFLLCAEHTHTHTRTHARTHARACVCVKGVVVCLSYLSNF